MGRSEIHQSDIDMLYRMLDTEHLCVCYEHHYVLCELKIMW